MAKSIEQFKAELIAKGMLVAAERLVIPKGTVPAPKPQPRVVSESTPIPEGFRRVSCAKACRATTLQPKSEPGRPWLCPQHRGENPPPAEPIDEPGPDPDDQGPLLHYRGNLYEPHIIADDGIAFKLRNGRTVTLDPSRVEWARRPKY